MPCYYTGSELGDAKLEAEDTGQRLTEVTRVACTAMAVVEVYGLLDKVNQESRDWWYKHQETDRLRNG